MALEVQPAGYSQAEHSLPFWLCSQPACSAPVLLLPCAHGTAAEMAAPGEPTGAQLGTSSKEGNPTLVSLPQVGAWLQQGEELGDVLPPRSPSCSPQLLSVPLGCVLLHLHYPASTSDEFCSHFITYCSISATFSAVLNIGSTFPSPEQLSISGRFCHVTIIPCFPDDGFYCRTMGSVSSAEHPLPGQLPMPPFHS